MSTPSVPAETAPRCSCVMRDYYGDNWSDPALHSPSCAISTNRVYHREYCDGTPVLGGSSCECGASRTEEELARLRAENERLESLRAAKNEELSCLRVELDEKDGEIASLRSQLAATREGETPEIPDKVTFEVWSGDECLAAGLDTQEEAAPTMTFFAHRYAPPVLVRSTTRRTRVDNG